MGWTQIRTAKLEAQTWDEGFEIASGYHYLKTGEYRIGYDQPPLTRILAALPLLRWTLDLPKNRDAWIRGDDVVLGHDFLYENRVDADSIVFAARMPSIFTTIALGLVIAWWTQRAFGAIPALLALTIFTFDPNVIANGRYVKSDICVALLCLLCAVAFGVFLKQQRWRWLLLCGILFGLAVATKFSALFLVVVFPAYWLLDRWRQRNGLAILHGLAAMAVVFLIGAITSAAVYAPEWRRLIPATQKYRAAHPEVRRLGTAVQVTTPRATRFMRICTQLGFQDHPLLVGVTKFLDHTSNGHPAYLLGKISTTGWWYYFPVAFFVKTPVGTLALLALAIGIAVYRWGSAAGGWLRRLRMEWWLCIIPIVLYIPFTIANRVNTGERHLFPIYPFLFILIAAIIGRARFRYRGAVVTTLTIALIAESIAIYPDYLAFFNVAVGGPTAGPNYLLDSNIDWGQDLLKFRSYWQAQGSPRLCFVYFGTADLLYYKVISERVPYTWETKERDSLNCLAAVSATPLHDLYMPQGPSRG